MTENEKKLLEEIAYYKAALDSLPNPIFLKDDNLHFTFFNKAYKEFFHLEEGQYIGMGVRDLPYLSKEDQEKYHLEDEELLQNSSVVNYEADFSEEDKNRESLYWSKGFIAEDGRRGLVGEIVDISHEKEIERRLSQYANEMRAHGIRAEEESMHDPMTGLHNRRVFEEHLPALIRECNLKSKPIFVYIIDLDNFKGVNDTFGHRVGDEVIKAFAKLVKNNIRQTDLGIRYGGDEFMLILPGIDKKKAIEKGKYLCERVPESIKLPDGQAVHCSIGISGAQGEFTLDACIQRADNALYQAKESGRGCVKYV